MTDPSRLMDAEMLTCAIVDGINRYLRELTDRGHLSPTLDDGIGSVLIARKYEIASDTALRWVVPTKPLN